MPETNGALTPYEAALAANNVYFTLKGWSAFKTAKDAGQADPAKPTPGMEKRSVIRREVTGAGTTSLARAGVEGRIEETFQGKTVGITSGFGYVLTFQHNGDTHALVATRGTRAEIDRWWKPDLATDAYFTPTAGFGGSHVHRGFALTFESIRPRLDANKDVFTGARYVHCVGHSLGGAIANLTAYHLQGMLPDTSVRLYTFGAPRVGLHLGFPPDLERALGASNVYRVSHHMDPITMIPTFPFLHVLGDDGDANNMILRSPNNKNPFDLTNHGMDGYIADVQTESWAGVRAMKHLPSFEDRLMKQIWESESDGWFKKGLKLMGAGVVWVLLKVLKGLLKGLLAAGIVVATPLDLLVRAIVQGAQLVGKLGKAVFNWIKAAGELVGRAVSTAADVTVPLLRELLRRFGGVVFAASLACLQGVATASGSYTDPVAMAAGLSAFSL
jgi:hypothetical protein